MYCAFSIKYSRAHKKRIIRANAFEQNKREPESQFNRGLSLIDLRITGPQSGPSFRKADLNANPGLDFKTNIALPCMYQISATLE